MARGGKGGDRILESRHLVGLFLGVVLLCGVFFTLGYVMGKTRFDSVVVASGGGNGEKPGSTPAVRVKPPAPTSAASTPDTGWDNYDPNKKEDAHIVPAPKAAPKTVTPPPATTPAPVPVASAKPQPAAATAKNAKETKQTSRYSPPAMPKNAIVLQVSAVKQQRDALEMADELQRKKFPAFVTAPTSDSYYRVQIGPYADMAAAQAALRSLEQAGFNKAIIKR